MRKPNIKAVALEMECYTGIVELLRVLKQEVIKFTFEKGEVVGSRVHI